MQRKIGIEGSTFSGKTTMGEDLARTKDAQPPVTFVSEQAIVMPPAERKKLIRVPATIEESRKQIDLFTRYSIEQSELVRRAVDRGRSVVMDRTAITAAVIYQAVLGVEGLEELQLDLDYAVSEAARVIESREVVVPDGLILMSAAGQEIFEERVAARGELEASPLNDWAIASRVPDATKAMAGLLIPGVEIIAEVNSYDDYARNRGQVGHVIDMLRS